MNNLRSAIKKIISDLYETEVGVVVDFSPTQFGDFSTNIALQIAKTLKKPPLEVAKAIVAKLDLKFVAKTDVVKPGFINFTMTDEYWLEQLKVIDENYGKNSGGKGESVQVEFISANPTGPLTLANGRGGYAGDVLASVLAFNGYRVEREYYINDAGNQISDLVKSVRQNQKSSQNDNPEVPYKGTYIKELAAKFQTKSIDDESDKWPDILTAELLNSYIKPSVKKMGIQFDKWFSEKQELYANGATPVKQTLKTLEKEGSIERKEGALWLKGEDSRDRVLVKSDGSYTYLLVDMAYHYNKFDTRAFDKVINLWGADHAGQVQSLKDGVKALGIDKPLDIILFQLVRLVRDGKEYKMSKRAGTYVAIDDLLDEVDPDVARWFFLMRDFNTQMEFDLDLAKEQSQKNPFFYVMYAYTRAVAILSRAEANHLEKSDGLASLNQQQRELVKQMSQFPSLITQLASSYEVYKLTFYGMELARCFHDYYEQEERIVNLSTKEAGPKLYLLSQFVKMFENYWIVLGIKPRTKM